MLDSLVCKVGAKNEEFFEDIFWDEYYKDYTNTLVSFDERRVNAKK